MSSGLVALRSLPAVCAQEFARISMRAHCSPFGVLIEWRLLPAGIHPAPLTKNALTDTGYAKRYFAECACLRLKTLLAKTGDCSKATKMSTGKAVTVLGFKPAVVR